MEILNKVKQTELNGVWPTKTHLCLGRLRFKHLRIFLQRNQRRGKQTTGLTIHRTTTDKE